MGSKSFQLPFGKGHLWVDLPQTARPTIIEKSPRAAAANPAEAIRHAFNHPVRSLPLKELACRRRNACILICDITRPVPNRLFLRPMIEDLMEAGIPADKICVLVATGLHRPNEGEELKELVGDDWVLSTVRVENHFARNDEDHIFLGLTGRRTPVKIDRRFVEADLRLATGLVEPHFMAGYSGGRKVVAPGIASAETIRTLHNARFMEDPLVRASSLAGNPLHEEQIEIIRRVGEIYSLNVVLNDRRELVYVNFGEIVQSHHEAAAFAQGASVVAVSRQFSTVVTSSAGYPLDKTYYQTVKAMVAPLEILRPGGTLVVASECSEGLGSKEFRESLSRLSRLGPEAFRESLRSKSLADVDEWQTELQLKAMRRGRVQLYSPALAADDRRLTGVEAIDSIELAIEQSIERTQDRDVAVIPEGPYLEPVMNI